MFTAETLSITFAVAAVGISLLAIFMMISSRGAANPLRLDQTEPAVGAVEAVRLEMAKGVWRFRNNLSSRDVIVDVFSHRSYTNGSAGFWRHELMNAPLHLPRRSSAEVTRIDRSELADVIIGWVDSDTGERASLYLRFPRRADDR